MATEQSLFDVTPTESLIYNDSIETTAIQNIMLIDYSVKEFQHYANANTFPIIYTSSCTREQLLSLLTSKFQNITRIAVVCHFSETPYFLNRELIFSDTNTQFIVDFIKQFHLSNMDFLACNTLKNMRWKQYYTKIHDLTGIPIGASIDNTGNIKYGGDWILESTQEDIQTIYFNEQLQNYSALLAPITIPFDYVVYTRFSSTLTAIVASQMSNADISGNITIYNDISYNTLSLKVTAISKSAFATKSNLTSITIKNNGNLDIGASAFQDCNNLTSVIIEYIGNINNNPNNIKINSYAFEGCEKLATVTLPNGVYSLNNTAFGSCKQLQSITIPKSVTYISPNNPFYNCTALTNITVDALNTTYKDVDGVLFDINGTALLQYPAGNTRTSYIIPDTVTIIGLNSFYNCKNLTSITIGKNVKSIGDNAFQGCSGLISIIIPYNVVTMGLAAFQDCSGLTNIEIQSTIIDVSFVELPIGITSISDNAFKGCTDLSNISIGDGIKIIGNNAFQSCTRLANIVIPNRVTNIGSEAFRGCTSLISPIIGSNVTSIGINAFNSCSNLTNIIIPDLVTIINPTTFQYCNNLTSVTIGSGVTSIGSNAFQDCSGLTNIYFYGNLPFISSGVFGLNKNDTAYYLTENSGSFSSLALDPPNGFTASTPFTQQPAPLNVRVLNNIIDASSGPLLGAINVYWDHPTDNSNVKAYEIRYWDTSNPSKITTTPRIGSASIRYTIGGLTYGKFYVFSVAAYDSIGRSKWTTSTALNPIGSYSITINNGTINASYSYNNITNTL